MGAVASAGLYGHGPVTAGRCPSAMARRPPRPTAARSPAHVLGVRRRKPTLWLGVIRPADMANPSLYFV